MRRLALLVAPFVVIFGASAGGLAPRATLAQQQVAGLSGVIAVATGGSHALALRVDGTVWGWGSNSDWELGVSTPSGPDGSRTPVQTTGLNRVRAIATGDDHGLALRGDGSVWAWGKNDHGQVGVPKGENCPHHPRPCVQAPVPVPGLNGVKAVAAAQDSSFALGADGIVWAWGDNEHGQLGAGSGADRVSPTKVGGVTDIVGLSAMGLHVVALRADGTVWGWGGRVGSPLPSRVEGIDDVAAAAAGFARNLALKADGTVWAWGAPGGAATAVAGLGPVTAIAGGALISAAVASDGQVWMWEISSGNGPAKPPTALDGLDGVVAIAMGQESNLALLADGTVWVWLRYGKPRPVQAPIAGTPTP
jgi:alpha-tubulin suppressor-like RCC1 family protein